MATIGAAKSPRNSPLVHRRRRPRGNAYPSSLPGSRSSSPGRNVMTKRAIFEINAVKNDSFERSFQDEPDEIKIEGIDEFNEVYRSAKRNSPTLPSFVTKPSSNNSYADKSSLSMEPCSLDAKDFSAAPASIDRASARRIIPDYVSAKADLNHRSDSFSSEHSEKRRDTKRERVRGGRSGRRYQTMQEQERNAVSQVTQKYLPTYILPVTTHSAKGHGGSETDVYSQSKRDLLPTYQSNVPSRNEQHTRNQVKHFDTWQQHSRLTSSGDSSNSEMPTNRENRRQNYIESKPIGSFEPEEEAAQVRTGRRPRNHRNRNAVIAPKQNNVSSLSSQQTGYHSHKLMDISHNVPGDEKPAIQTSPIVVTKHRRRERRSKHPFIAEPDEKYSTIPADFKPGEMMSALAVRGNLLHKDSGLQGPSLDSNCNEARVAKRNELMITSEQTLVSSEDAEKKSSDVKAEIANHSVHTQSLQTTQSTDKPRFATSNRANAELVDLPPRTNQVNHLRNFFDNEPTSKIEFGRVYTKPKNKPTSREIAQPVEKVVKPEVGHVVSQPTLTVVKISEDYWPRNEETQKLLNKHSTNSSDMLKNVESVSTEMTGLPEASNITQYNADHTAIPANGLLNSPKETNLNDPIDFILDETGHDQYQLTDLNHKDTKSTSDSSQTAHIGVQTSTNFEDTQLNKSPEAESQWNYNEADAKLENFDSMYKNADGVVSDTPQTPHEFIIKDPNSYQSHMLNNGNDYIPISPSERKNSIVLVSAALPINDKAKDTKNSAESLDEGIIDDIGSTYLLQTSLVGNGLPAKQKRRKLSSAPGQGSDSSNNSGESNRSKSDPLADRKKSPNSEEDRSVDSNLQYSLKSKEHKEADQRDDAKSNISERSDNGSIQSDVVEETSSIAIETNPITEALAPKNVKNLKKKSFSDPDSKAVLTAGLLDAASLPGSSSDPNLADVLNSQGSLNRIQSASRSSHETSLASCRFSKESSLSDIADITQSIEKLTHSVVSLDRPPSNIHPQEKPSSATPELQNENESFFKPIPTGETDLSEAPTEQRSPSVGLEQEEEQFEQLFQSMSTNYAPTPETKGPSIAHARSVSEPVTDMFGHSCRSGNTLNDGRIRRPGIVQPPAIDDVLSDEGHSPKSLPGTTERPGPAATLPRSTAAIGLDYNFRNQQQELRKHVMSNFFGAEESYVNALRTLHECYLEPLRRDYHHLCEPRLLDEIFYKIPELWHYHERFFSKVRPYYLDWDPDSKIGELYLETFNDDNFLELYTSYVSNFQKSKKAIATACDAKAGFKQFLEHCQREKKDKKSLADLMIQPVQRPTRYRLLIIDFLKHTPEDHPDRDGLLAAKKEIDAILLQVNQGEKTADRSSRILQDIEQAIEGDSEISGNPKRKFLHLYFCTDVKSAKARDRSLWLFNDILLCATMKKGRQQTLRRSSMNLAAISQDHPLYDVYGKHRFLWKYPLQDINLKGALDPYQRSENEKQVQVLQGDLDVIEDMQEMVDRLSCEHMDLEDLIDRLRETLHQKMLEKQQPLYQNISVPGRLEMLTSTHGLNDGTKTYQFDFNPEQKAEFERHFWEAKRSLNSNSGSSEPSKNSKDPSFLKSIAIIKTRNGMQFSCAASNIQTFPGTREVWVCNTDGYVGQICFLTLDPDPIQTQCITVCNSKICCIAQVPAWDRKLVPISSIIHDITKEALGSRSNRRSSSSNNNLAKTIMSFDEESDETDEDNTSPISTINTTSPYSTLNTTSPYNTLNSSTSTLQQHGRRNRLRRHSSAIDWGSDSDEEVVLPVMSPLMTNSFRKRFLFATKCHTRSYPCLPLPVKEEMIEADSNEFNMMGRPSQKPYMPPSFGGGGAYKKDEDGVTRYGSLGDLLCDEQGEQNRDVISGSRVLGNQSSMWLGTEDGKINIYSTSEAVRASKDSIQLHHTSAVQCILNYQDQVFVALSNGDLICYARDHTKESQWDFTNKKCLQGFSSNNPISKMLVVNERELWCGCQNQIRILDMKTHNEKSYFSVSSDNKRQIYCMASYGYGVWVALDKKPQARLYHSVTHEQIVEVDVSQAVSKMLTSSDPIIRQHKAACLRITSLLVCKNLLWVGTSAGVVLTLTIPSISETTTPTPLPPWIQPQGLPFGHTGHVRFLTAVEIPEKEQSSGRSSRRASTKRRSSAVSTSSQSKSSMLVISGGDGYENFQSSTAEAAGKDDSTNHLLIWKIP